jgi:hypothetical protein
MSAKLIAVVILLSLAGCATQQVDQTPMTPISLTEKQLLVIRAVTAKTLIDPESARFGQIIAGRHGNGNIVVCGSVNAKNRLGGCVGESPFDGRLLDTDPPVFELGRMGGQDFQNDKVLRGCHAFGLYL